MHLSQPVSVLLFALRGLLDRIPDVIDSAGRARDAWQRFRKPDLPPPADDEEPPLAAQVVRASGRPVAQDGSTARVVLTGLARVPATRPAVAVPGSCTPGRRRAGPPDRTPAALTGRAEVPQPTAFAAARPAVRPEKMQPPRNVPSSER